MCKQQRLNNLKHNDTVATGKVTQHKMMVTGKNLVIVMTTDKVTSPYIYFMQFKQKVKKAGYLW